MAFHPDLGHNVRLRIDGAYPAAKLAPEFVIIDLGCHIQTPAIDAKTHPVLGHPPQEFTHSRGICIELRQCGQVVPPVVTNNLLAGFASFHARILFICGVRAKGFPALQGRLFKMKPIHVRRSGTVFQGLMKLPESPAGMVEHSIQYHPHAAGMAFIQEGS
ncbi:hypothetical protein SDC9_199427 [bioreactor metagenome]|uniref:Uncharacterized protein n=1 Tax=bioreactor metagenome TaxID=1076179 RepID=A0A645IKF7_9ZZZZ